MTNILKKSFIILLGLFLIITFSCKKEENRPSDTTGPDDNPPIIEPINVDILKVDENIPELYVGMSYELGFESSSKPIIKSDNENIVSINFKNDNKLELTCLSEGTTSIHVILNNLEETRTIKVTNVILNVSDITLAVGKEIELSSFITSNVLDKLTLNGLTDDTFVLNDNKLTCLIAGNYKISVNFTCGDLSISKDVNIRAIKMNEMSFKTNTIPTTMDLGTSFNIEITKDYEDDIITITSSNPSVVEVSGNMLVAKSEGTAKISLKSTLTNYVTNKNITVNYNWPTDTIPLQGVYLGVKNYGSIKNTDLNNFVYKFMIGDEIKEYTILKVGDYELHNLLEEGSLYGLSVSNNQITNLTPYGTSSNKIIIGKINNLNKYEIVINDNNYELLKTTKAYKVNKKAGGASLATYNVKVGDEVILTLSNNGYVDNIYLNVKTKEYTPVVTPVAGMRTLSNFLRIGLSAVGHALYVYGGAWDYQDVASSNQARSIGVADSWVRFFYETDGTYNYKNTTASQSYYPFGAFNEYYYAGVDCSGFVGWIMYNLLNTESGKSGYVMGSNKMAKTFSEMGLGSYTKTYSAPTSATSAFKVGDIISCTGHVWICLGVCNDGSMVIMHSTPSTSYAGYNGGGAQLGAIGSSEACQAYKLADQYNKKYYPDWATRYPTSLKSYSTYLAQGNTNNGKFSWYINSNGVLDPDNIVDKTPDVVLKVLFNEEQ